MPPSHPLKVTARLYCGDEIAMGPGKADLLDMIGLHGSISAAARAMDMSYRRAWLLVDAMNRCWSEPVVATAPGSAHGGGARVTPFGETVLADYRSLQRQLQAATDCPEQAALLRAMRSEPGARG